MKRSILAVTLLTGSLVMAAAASSEAAIETRSLPGIAGAAWQPSEAPCFSTASFSNAVQNTACAGARSWLVALPLRTDLSAYSTYFFASSSAAGAAPQCRYVIRSAGDVNINLGGLVAVNGTNYSLGSVYGITTSDTAQIDCTLTQYGKKLSSVFWVLQ